MYEIFYSESAKKSLKKLPKNIFKRIIASLERCRVRPYSYLKKIVASEYYSLRVGNHRVILDVKDNKLIIFVILMGHRKNIYKKL